MDGDKTITAHFIYIPDETPPTVEILKPIDAIYILNQKIIPFNMPLIVGSLTIEVEATDEESGVDRVEFYIDGELKGEDNTSDYFWLWSDTEPGEHTIKVQYRTPEAAANNPAGTDYENRSLQVMILGDQ